MKILSVVLFIELQICSEEWFVFTTSSTFTFDFSMMVATNLLQATSTLYDLEGGEALCHV